MKYIVKDESGKIMCLTVAGKLPTIVGVEVLGLASDLNPEDKELDKLSWSEVEIEAERQELISEAIEAQAEKWTKEDHVDASEQPMMEDGITPDETWTHVEAIEAQEAVYETVPAVRGMRLVDDVEKIAAVQSANLDAYIANTLANAQEFGKNLMDEFTRENMKMGITQDGKTSSVRKAMTEVILALTTGSLYDAIDEAKAIPAEKKDVKYITDARLISFINKIETYLGQPLTETL